MAGDLFKEAKLGKHSYAARRAPSGSTIKEKIEFHSMPVPESGCWLWVASLNHKGYGQVNVDGKMMSAHRASYIAHIGPIGGGLFVCHTCDIPSCVNPAHLFLGTNSDNMRDMVNKGRANPNAKFQKGNLPPSTKLTPEQVIEIRNSEQSSRKLAKIYPVGSSHIRAIRAGNHWETIT